MSVSVLNQQPLATQTCASLYHIELNAINSWFLGLTLHFTAQKPELDVTLSSTDILKSPSMPCCLLGPDLCEL